MNRRRFLLSALAAPAVITTAGLLMPVRAIKPSWWPEPYDGPIRIVAASGNCDATSSDIWFMNGAGLWRATYVGDAYVYARL